MVGQKTKPPRQDPGAAARSAARSVPRRLRLWGAGAIGSRRRSTRRAKASVRP